MNTTKLQAVNRLLRMVQELPVSGLESLLGTDAQALEALDYAINEVCLEQHPFCTEEIEVSPDADGEVKVGSDVLGMTVRVGSDRDRWVLRNQRLYDRLEGKGYQVDADKLTILVTRRIEWEDMQEHQRQLVLMTAARTWVRDKTGDPAIMGALQREWELARGRFDAAEASHVPVNVFESCGHWQRGLSARRGRRGYYW